MKTMNMPGFRAGASIYIRNRFYYQLPKPYISGLSKVVPQLPMSGTYCRDWDYGVQRCCTYTLGLVCCGYEDNNTGQSSLETCSPLVPGSQ